MQPLLLLLALAAAPPPEADSHDLVLLTAKRPYRVRLHLRIAGRPFLAGWNRQMGQLLRFLDTDGDGRLSPAEARRAPSHDQWQQISGGAEMIVPDEAPDFRVLAAGKSHATRADLLAYYGNSTVGPLQVVWSWGTGTAGDPLSDMLWQKLDADKDGKLSRAELLAARRDLAALDDDDDETISMSELLGRPFAESAFTLAPGPAHGLARGGLPFLSLRHPEPNDEAAGELRRRYGRPLHPATDLELLVPLDGADHPVRLFGKPTAGLRFAAMRSGEVIVADDLFVELLRPRPMPARPRRRAAPLLEAFRSLDGDGNGLLDSEEVHRPPFTYVSWLRLADRDGDGKLSRQEFAAFADLKEGIPGHVTTLRVEDLGRSLFRFADEDGDGRLGPRELNQLCSRLGPWLTGREALRREQLPRHFRLTLSHGGNLAPPRQAPPPVPERGPLWFRKMDRNRDGDVSRQEWLGSAELFRRIDENGDGLISLEEAERFARRNRK